MQIKRDYSEPFFGPRKPKRNYTRLIFVFGLVMGSVLLYVTANRESLQEMTMEALGMGPTPTALPAELALEGVTLARAGDFEAASAFFERAIAQQPDNISFLYEYGLILIDVDDTTRALELGDTILSIDPNDARGYALKAQAFVFADNASAAIPAALAGLDVGTGYTSELYESLARSYANVGRYEEALEAGILGVEADPLNVDARRSYAYALSWVSDYEEAINQLEIAIASDPSQLPAYFELAVQYLAQNRDQDAIDLYDQILAVQPRNPRAFLRLCETYRKVGQFERAIGYCEDAVSEDPESVAAFYQLGILKYNRFDFPGALDAFARCVDLDGSSLECTYRLGLSYYYVDDCDNAWGTLQDSLLMAQNRAGVETAVANIREGLIAVGQKCPQYGSVAPTATPAPTDAVSDA